MWKFFLISFFSPLSCSARAFNMHRLLEHGISLRNPYNCWNLHVESFFKALRKNFYCSCFPIELLAIVCCRMTRWTQLGSGKDTAFLRIPTLSLIQPSPRLCESKMDTVGFSPISVRAYCLRHAIEFSPNGQCSGYQSWSATNSYARCKNAYRSQWASGQFLFGTMIQQGSLQVLRDQHRLNPATHEPLNS